MLTPTSSGFPFTVSPMASALGYVLSKGRVVAAGTPEELKNRAEVREAYFGADI